MYETYYGKFREGQNVGKESRQGKLGRNMHEKRNGEETREKLFSCLLSLCLSDWALHFITPVCSVFSLSPISSYLLCEKPFPISTDMKYTPVLVWVLKLDSTQTFCSAFLISASRSFTSSALVKEKKATQFYWLTVLHWVTPAWCHTIIQNLIVSIWFFSET